MTDESGEWAMGTVHVQVVAEPAPRHRRGSRHGRRGHAQGVRSRSERQRPGPGQVRLIGWNPAGTIGKVLCEAGCIYTPDPDAVPYRTTFTYTITDDHGGTREGTVTIDVIANGAGHANDDNLHVIEHDTT